MSDAPDNALQSDQTRRLESGREYIGVQRIEGPLVFVENTHPVGYRELVECITPDGEVRLGQRDVAALTLGSLAHDASTQSSASPRTSS